MDWLCLIINKGYSVNEIFYLSLKLLPSLSLLYFVVLRAMKEDSEKVPSLLTDYILKGEFYNGICAMVGKFWLVDKYIVLLIDEKMHFYHSHLCRARIDAWLTYATHIMNYGCIKCNFYLGSWAGRNFHSSALVSMETGNGGNMETSPQSCVSGIERHRMGFSRVVVAILGTTERGQIMRMDEGRDTQREYEGDFL